LHPDSTPLSDQEASLAEILRELEEDNQWRDKRERIKDFELVGMIAEKRINDTDWEGC